MMTEIISSLIVRDLNKLRSEIELYHSENKIWHTEKNIANSAGNLCLHLIGNLKAYIGAVLGNTGYVRNRPLEFSQKDVPRHELIVMIEETITTVNESLSKVSDEDLDAEYPLLVFEHKTSTGYFLVHLATHLTYHLGQINYHRRLLDISEEIV
ncbi:MAG TPA: DUF1572 family protein [Chitinophagaceae bacterium]|nr:DUF1572 family protein [Chitinophagaceae bacterium]